MNKNNFQDFPCNKCGWCCKRTPCPLGLYLGQEPLKPCSLLRETKPNEFECGLILDEKNSIKKQALKTLLFAGEGCSHIYGPSPISLMRSLVEQGLTPQHPNWKVAVENTHKEYSEMANQADDKVSIMNALNEFSDYCREKEKNL